MKYYPDIHHRRSIRLKNYDYSQSGAYFITICTQNKALYFEEYQELKEIVNRQWQMIPNRYAGVILDEYIVMPNHIHGIIIAVGATLAVARYEWAGVKPAGNEQAGARPAMGNRAGARLAPNPRAGVKPAPTTTVGEIVGAFKSLCVHDWLEYIKRNNANTTGKFWQRNYYEHIIRNDSELNKIRQYIQNNPVKWQLDRENPHREGNDHLEDEIFKVKEQKSTGQSMRW